MSNPPSVVGNPAIQSTPIIPPRREGSGRDGKETAWAAVLRFHPLASLARADILGDVEVLPDPEGTATNQRSRLGPPEVPPDRPIVALAQHLSPQAPARGDAQPVRCALAPPIQQAAPHQERAAWRGPARRQGRRRRAGRRVCRVSPPPPLGWAQRRRPQRAPAPRLGRTPARGSGLTTGPAGLAPPSSPSPGLAPIPQGQQTYSDTGGRRPPSLGLAEGIVSPSSTSAKVTAATRRFAAHPARTMESAAHDGVSRPRRENSSC
jgi:hypothetical protein